MRRRRSTRKFVNLNGRVSLPIDYEQCCIDRLNPPPILLKNSISAPVRNSDQRNHGCAEERSLPSRLFLRAEERTSARPALPSNPRSAATPKAVRFFLRRREKSFSTE